MPGSFGSATEFMHQHALGKYRNPQSEHVKNDWRIRVAQLRGAPPLERFKRQDIGC